MTEPIRRVVTGHDENGKSVVLSDGAPSQNHGMRGASIGADFFEIWNDSRPLPVITSVEAREPNSREFTIMPVTGNLIRIIDIFPPQLGGKRTVMHRTKSLDYAVVIEGEIVLVLEDSEIILKKSDVVVQRGTNHAWENRSDKITRMAFFHVDAEFSQELTDRLPGPLNLMR